MKKELSIGKILIAVLLMLTASLCAYMGVMAIKKSMYLNLSFNASPSVKCEIYMKTNSQDSFSKIFSNIRGSEMIAPDMFLNERTSTLSFSNSFNGGLGTGFFLKVYNHENKKLFVETAGAGTSYTSIVIGAYNGETALNETLIVSSVTGDAQIKFTQVEEVIPTFTATQFDLTATGNTLIKKNNYYYTPIGIDAVFKLIKTAGADDEVSVTSLKINETAKNYGAWYNKTTDIMTIPSANVNGTIEFDSLASWDGDIAPSFSGGDGTPASPYQLSTGGHFALLANIINTADDADGNGTIDTDDVYTSTNGTKYHVQTCRTANYEMTNNIYLNDETFTYNTTTGKVDITDGVNTGTIGTGNNSTTLGNTTYSGIVENWTPIGNYKSGSNYAFQGSFDGNAHKVEGCYSYQTYNGVGLFGTIWSETATYIKNLSLYNSFLINSTRWVGLLGLNYKNAVMYNCVCADSISIGSSFAGPLIGENFSHGNLINSYSINNYSFSANHSGGVSGINNYSSIIRNTYSVNVVVEGSGSKGGVCGGTYNSAQVFHSYTNHSVLCAVNSTEYCGTFTSPTSAVTNFANNSAGNTMVAPYTDNLLTALQTWVDDSTNNPDGIYGDWTRDETGVINNGYPYLVGQTF